MRLRFDQLLSTLSNGSTEGNQQLQPPPTPIELKEWAWNTLLASVIGMAYCGTSQAMRNKRLGVCCGSAKDLTWWL